MSKRITLDVGGTLKNTAKNTSQNIIGGIVILAIFGCLFAPWFADFFEDYYIKKYNIYNNSLNYKLVQEKMLKIKAMLWIVACIAWSVTIALYAITHQ